MTYQLEEKNRDFRWQGCQGPFSLITEEQAASWNDAGYFLLEGVLSEAQLAMLEQEIDPLEAKTNQYLRSLEDGRMFIARADELTFSTHIVLKSEKVKAFVREQLFVDLTRDLMGDGVRLYWDQAVYKKPGTPQEFPWHQDNGYTYIEPQDYLTCWIPMTDATIDNGCPWVVPGVHRHGTLHHEATELGFQCLKDPEGAVPVPAKAGDIVVFSSLTPHRTGPNLTDSDRKAYIVQYAHDGAIGYPRGTDAEISQDDPDRQFVIST